MKLTEIEKLERRLDRLETRRDKIVNKPLQINNQYYRHSKGWSKSYYNNALSCGAKLSAVENEISDIKAEILTLQSVKV